METVLRITSAGTGTKYPLRSNYARAASVRPLSKNGEILLELKIPPLIQVFLVGFGMLAISRLIPSLTLSIPASISIGVVVVLIGAIVALAGVLEFRKVKTTVDPRYPQKSEILVITGIYKISRNPMYLGFLILLFGWFVILENVATLLLLPIFLLYINQFQIKPEEKFLLKKFGSDFSQYCNKVRRWI